ncbi:pyruvate dehydrogenase (acetyl-transferring) E1 component subunit alpha [Cucumibacter marinus]|uniref:pyruvate dehydrogenase (acetyl-transferring) E1 component subunit alpha n=1 Tax=Cucumibacter marinus TaxID=1121252 RepID=UPI0003FBD9C2|nr:pyruvate dehydrogenase (acetyl-transferring) E1 component subunit alpha [Cucumibacter marinus]
MARKTTTRSRQPSKASEGEAKKPASKSTASKTTASKPTASKSRSATSAGRKPASRSAAGKSSSTTAKANAAASRSNAPKFDKAQEFKAFRDMLLIRRFEEKAGQMYGMGLIGGFCHLYIGQEAVVTGITMAAKPEDATITGYRDHGHMLAVGMDPNGVMAELTGRQGGLSKGKGGSMHMFSMEKRFYGGHGIVGAQVSLGTGLGFAAKYRKDKSVSLTYFGDGAANQGQVYESFNMAKLWNLPVVYVIENNKYAMGTSVERSASTTDFSQRGRSFDIPGEQVDGMDVRLVKEAAERAIDHARSGKGPYILEMLTYRYRGHSMSDPAKYRSKEEVQTMRSERDPIEMVRKRILDQKWATEDELKDIDKEIRAVVSEAEKFATEDDQPDASELWTDITVSA